MNNEIWKTHPKYTNYMVSNKGRIRSKTRNVTYPDGHTQQITGKLMHPYISKWGYSVILLNSNKHRIHKQVNDLVAETFIPNPHHYPETHHKDYDKQNNNVENLIWVSHEFNMSDKKEHYQKLWKMQHINSPIIASNHKLMKCPLCGQPMSITATICKSCLEKYQDTHLNGYKINIGQIVAILKYYHGNLTKTGKLFEVSGNAIVRKLKKFNLPYHSKDYQ